MQAEELGAGLELGEGTREVHVAEDLVRLGRLVGAAEEDGVGVVADHLDPVEVLDDRGHGERQHALAREGVRGGARGRLQLVVLELDPGRAQVARQLRP